MKLFLQDNLIEKIPLAAAMSITVEKASDRCVVLSAPLAGNTNHQGTGFGGSLYSLAVLSGWGLLTVWLERHNLDGSVVVKSVQMDYLRPVSGDFLARCVFGSEEEVERMKKTLLRRGRARILLNAEITVADDVAARLEGEYVIMMRKPVSE